MINLDNIKDLFEKYAMNEEFSGVALIRKGEEEIFSFAQGYAHRGFKISNSFDTMFDTASITKLFTAVSILQLVDKKLVSLEDKVLNIIEIGETSISKDVTIYQLLTHTSGIGDDADEEAGESYEEIWKNKPCYSVRELKDFLPQFKNKKANFEPGQGCRYNNCAYILLGLVIEKITGKNYRDYIKENVFDKLSMSRTDFLSMDEIHENVAEGYSAICNEKDEIIAWKKNIYSYPPVGGTDGGAYTTVHDLNIFLKGLREGKLLSKELTQEVLMPKELFRENDLRSFYKGYGIEFTVRKRDNKVYCIKKDGSNVGVACDIKYYPEIDTTVTILSNTDACNIWELSAKISENLGVELW